MADSIQWRPFLDHYAVSENGDVKDVRTGRLLKIYSSANSVSTVFIKGNYYRVGS